MKALGFAAVAALATLALAPAAHAQRQYPVSLTYTTPAEVQRGEPSIVLAPVVDARADHQADVLGSIRGGFGNPLKTLVTERPVADVFGVALRDALTARNLASDAGPHRMVVRLVRFDCNQLYPREAHAEIVVRIEDQSGAQLFEATYTAGQARGGGPSGGIFAPIEPLRAITNLVMQQVIDRALDDPALRAVLASAPAPAELTPASAEAPAEAAPAPEATAQPGG